MSPETLGTSGRDDASRAPIAIALAFLVVVVVVLVALAVDQPGAPSQPGTPNQQGVPAAGTERARTPSIEPDQVTLVRPPAWVPADRLAAPTPGTR